MGKVPDIGKDAAGERFTQLPKLYGSLCSQSRHQLLTIADGVADNIDGVEH